MKIDLDTISGYIIHSYDEGKITVRVPLARQLETAQDEIQPSDAALETLHQSLIITPERLVPDWPPTDLSQLTVVHLEEIVALEPELVLLGTGKRLRFPDPALVAPLLNRGIGVEYMDSAAACRTYNLLAADERRVAAAILIASPRPPAAPGPQSGPAR